MTFIIMIMINKKAPAEKELNKLQNKRCRLSRLVSVAFFTFFD